jgi:hypothetical protein
VDLPAAQAVRVERLREWDVSANGRHPVSLIVQYVAQIPDTDDAVVLTFSTPALGLARELQQLFHQMACTLRFDPADHPR